MNYPKCVKKDFQVEYFGHKVDDPYHWLTDSHDPEVLAWVRQENEYTDKWFDTEKVDAKIAELKSSKRKSLYESISQWGDFLLATKREDGYPLVVRITHRLKRRYVRRMRDFLRYVVCRMKRQDRLYL